MKFVSCLDRNFLNANFMVRITSINEEFYKLLRFVAKHTYNHKTENCSRSDDFICQCILITCQLSLIHLSGNENYGIDHNMPSSRRSFNLMNFH